MPRPADLLWGTANSLEDWTAWRYLPLSYPTPTNLPPEVPVPYSVPANPAERYVDARHFYFTSSMPVVQVMTRSTAAVIKHEDPSLAYGARSWYYGYQEAMYNRMGRGFQGFRRIIEANAVSATTGRGHWITTTFHQKFPLVSRVESVEVAPVLQRTRPLRRETNTWRCGLSNRGACPTVPVGNTVYTPFLDTQVVQVYDLAAAQSGSSALVSTTTTVNATSAGASSSGWDAYGNLRNQVTTVADGGTGGSFVASHVTTTANSYTIDATNWWIDKLDASTVSTSISYAGSHALPSGSSAPPRTVSTSYAWNADRTPQSQTVQPGIPNQQVQTVYGYPSPSYGLPSSVTQTASGASPPTRSTFLNYTKDGASVAADGYFVLQTTNAAGHLTTTETRPRDGQVKRVIDPNGLRAVTQHDAFGRPIQVESRGTNNALLEPVTHVSLTRCSPTTGSCPGGYGEGAGQTFAAMRATTVKAGSPTQVTWSDKLGRPVKRSVRGFNGSFVQTLTEYDRMGTVARESTPHFAGGTAHWTTFDQYDQLGRVQQKTAPGSEMDPVNGNVLTKYAYSGTRTDIRVQGTAFSSTAPCPANRPCMAMARWHDALGRLVRTEDALGGTVKYWYDGAGNPVAAQDAEGHVTRASYNDLGHRTHRMDPNAGSASFTYDGFGQVLTQTDARNVTTTHTYDALGRLIQRTSTNPAGAGLPAESVRDTWEYDPPGANGGAGLLGVQRRQRGLGLPVVWQESYAWESTTKRLSSQTTTMEGESPWTTGYAYDPTYGREDTVTYPSGLSVRTGYTADGYANSLSNASTGFTWWTATSQDAWGATSGETFGNGIVGTHTSYASTGQSQQKRWTNNAVLFDQFQYAYDSFGNLTSQQRAMNLGTPQTVQETYAYDRLQRLTQSTRIGVPGSPAPVSLGYSASGNLSYKSDNGQATPGSYAYGGNGCGPHAVTSVARPAPLAARTYGCDAAGNVTHGNELSAVYDFQNLPRRVQRTGSPHPGSTAFRYAATGARYEEVTGSGVTTRLGVRGYEKVSGAGVVSSPRHRHELGPVIVTRAGANEEVVYVTRDRLGSLVGVLPNNPYKGLLKSYDAFGKPREGNFKDNGKTPEAGRLLLGTLTERGFTGHGHIDEGRVIHMNGRIYDYALGRFLGVDPIIQFPANSQSLNPYSYILNNPLAGTDPSGYMSRIGRYMLSRIHAQTGSCMGVGHCQEYSDKTFLMGATAGLRPGLTAGGVPPGKGPRNGADLANRIAKAFSTDADEIGAVAARIDGAAFANGAVTAAFSRAFNDENHSQAPETRVELHYTDAWGDYNHAYIAVIGPEGETWGIRAGPSDRAGGDISSARYEAQSPNASGSSGGSWGHVEAAWGNHPAMLSDFSSRRFATQVVGTTQRPMSEVMEYFVGYGNAVNAAKVSYNPFTRNSNSFAFDAASSFSGARLSPVSGTNVPAWDRTLGVRYAPFKK
ncbi:RHS repeat-associated core domain-containing protein [Dokdonella sp.]|uniref:RHS repeat domain-containing protein n=1 Tax=Dokdonella sp. TaxID=2291710 RepID=UPI0025C4336C|nr:RHS repeat-associated core domain-containing protein [Dokdonella sp.]MBX3692640.1 RHS repeat protein [Dokdonella sp.]